MRTLVEQTESVAMEWIEAARKAFGLDIGLDVLMAGRSDAHAGLPHWMMNPARPAILIGTQDLLVSAALMRAYGASRARWPVDFALLHNDALWVFDEVQLTGAALTTSAQLEAFRRSLQTALPSRTLWMSATLDPAWLATVDFKPIDTWRPHDLCAADIDAARHLWEARKRLERLDLDTTEIGKKPGLAAYATALATKASEAAKPGTNTILFLNTVARAQAVFSALRRIAPDRDTLLVHSRFRKADRDRLTKHLGTTAPGPGRIIVASQVLEAGIDVSSSTVITEIAPWSSLVQRFGRCNRFGECGEVGADVFWVDLPESDSSPYAPDDLAAARPILESLSHCGPAELAAIPPTTPPRGAVIRRQDLLGLFDTDSDLSGFDLDVSLYVRDADDTDVRVFWRPLAGTGTGAADEEIPPPHRDEICAVPLGRARKWLRNVARQAFTWDWIDRRWVRLGDLWPGALVLVDSNLGGYDETMGFDPESKKPVSPVVIDDDEAPPQEGFDDDTDTLRDRIVPLLDHLRHVRDEAARLCASLGVPPAETHAVVTSSLWHDLGKAHDVFKARCGLEPEAPPLAKTPSYDWRSKDPRNRRHFRHELASALAWLQHEPQDEAHDLVAYLIAAHHGKVRMGLRALPDEPGPNDLEALFARGVWDGDRLPALAGPDLSVPETELRLDVMKLGGGSTGRSWATRSQGLLDRYGPFRLAFLETLVRIADWRASEREQRCDSVNGGGDVD